MLVLGIDPGPTECGWAIVECDARSPRHPVVDCGQIATDELLAAATTVGWQLSRADLFAIEDPVGHPIGRQTHPAQVQAMLRTLLVCAKLVARLDERLTRAGRATVLLSCPEVRKRLCNKGAANDGEVAYWLEQHLVMPRRSNDHKRDAMAVAWAGWQEWTAAQLKTQQDGAQAVLEAVGQ